MRAHPRATLGLRRNVPRQRLEPDAVCLLHGDRDVAGRARLAISDDARLAGVRAADDDAAIAIHDIGRRVRTASHPARLLTPRLSLRGVTFPARRDAPGLECQTGPDRLSSWSSS